MPETDWVLAPFVSLLLLATAGGDGAAPAARPTATGRERVIVSHHHAVISETVSVVPDGEAPVLLQRTLHTSEGRRVATMRPGAGAARVASAVPRGGWTRTPEDVLAALAAQGQPTRGATVLRQRGAHRRPGWRVRLRANPSTLSRPLVWVDDASMAVLWGPDQTRRSEAWAFDRNPLLDPVAQRFELAAFPVFPELPTSLADSRFDVRNCGNPKAPAFCVLQEVEPDEAGDFLFTPPSMNPADHERPDDLFAAGSIYVHADRFAAFAQTHQLPLPPCVQAEGPAILLANYQGFTGRDSIPVANAGYTGDCDLMAFFGQGPHADWGYDADVIRHELTHGVIAAQMGPDRVLGRPALRADAVTEDAGALGEAVSDFVAAVMAGDPEHAEYTRAFDGGHARSADNDLRCPQAMRGEIHADSEPMAGALWEAAEVIGPELVTPVVDALAMLDEDASFEEASAAFLDLTALELGEGAAEQLRAALERHNLLACDRILDAAEAPASLLLLPNSGASGRYEPMRPPPLQFRVDVPAGQTSMQMSFAVTVAPEPGWAPLGDVHALVRIDEPLVFAYETDAEGVVQVEASPDLHVPHIAGPGAEAGELSVEVRGGSVVYVALFNQGLHRARISALRVTFDDAPVEDGTGSSGTSGDDTAGQAEETSGGVGSGTGGGGSGATADASGCRVESPMRGRALWAMLLLYAGLIRRRGLRP